MKKMLLFIATVFYTVATMFAVPRTTGEAFAIALEHFQAHATTKIRSISTPILIASSNQLLGKTTTRGDVSEEAFFIFNSDQQRFVIVSADDRMKPILAYSDNGAFVVDSIPPHILSWLQMYAKEQIALMDLTAPQRNLVPLKVVNNTSFPKQVTPLLGDIKWNQSTPYNNFCPSYNGEKLVTGCVATAMAMVMKYHNYPERGKGQKAYTTKKLQMDCSFDFDTSSFEWNNMLPTYAQVMYSSEQATAVATLMKACGVAVDMDYGPASLGGSGAYSQFIAQRLIDYFNYDSNVRYVMRDYYSTSEWMEMIKKEISERRPILYGGSSKESGHEFVFDGYDEQDMVHVNWGWDGHNNGYFEVSSLTPDSPGIGGGSAAGGGFIYNQDMVIGIQRPTVGTQYISQFFMQSSLRLSVDKVNKGANFTLTASATYNMNTAFDGDFGVLLIKDGITTVLHQETIKVSSMSGWSKVAFPITIPASVANGDYVLCIATKDIRENNWSKVRAMPGYDAEFNAHVEGNEVIFTSVVPDLRMSGTFEIDHTLYNLRSGDFTVSIENDGDIEYRGEVAIILLPVGSSDKYTVIATDQLILAPREQKELTISGAVKVQAGSYNAYLAVSYGDVFQLFNNPVSTKVKPRATEASKISLASPITLPKTMIEEGEKLTLEFQIECTGGIYDDRLYAFIFAQGQESSNIYLSQKVFLEVGKQDVVISGYPGTAAGTYSAILCYMKNEELVQLMKTPNFTITTPTGIEDGATERNFIIYPQPVGDILNIHPNEDISKIEIISISGQVMMTENVSICTGETYILPVNKLVKGHYVLMLYSYNKLYREKFIKK